MLINPLLYRVAMTAGNDSRSLSRAIVPLVRRLV